MFDDGGRVKRVSDMLRVLRYLLAMADERGRTHGEKHHLHEVIGMVTVQMMSEMGVPLGIERNIDPTTDISDIPF